MHHPTDKIAHCYTSRDVLGESENILLKSTSTNQNASSRILRIGILKNTAYCGEDWELRIISSKTLTECHNVSLKGNNIPNMAIP